MQRMLTQDTPHSRSAFRSTQRAVAKAVRDAKTGWIESVAERAERARGDGCERWKCINQLRSIHLGRRSATTSAVFDEEGNLNTSPEAVRLRWHQHIHRVLNIQSEFDLNIIEEVPRHAVRPELDDVPDLTEVIRAVRSLRLGTAGGISGIVPDLVVYGGLYLYQHLQGLIADVWRSGRVPADWRDAEIVPISKTGGLRSCDNWRGISLLDVIGKLFARILQDRLQTVAEDILPDSQCGFRKGRGCIDMVFMARQLVEKSIEHDSTLYALFIDLKKAYDSIPRAALWLVLAQFGVPPRMLSLIESLHDGMEARVRVSRAVTDTILVNNGLRQGCPLAPVLFNLYFSAVVTYWRAKSSAPGVCIRYRIGRRLVGDRTAKSRLQPQWITESQFADDAALYTTSRASLGPMASEFIQCASPFGFTVSIPKTKGMAVGDGSVGRHLNLGNGQRIEMADSFTYLGSAIFADGSVDGEVTCRIAKASNAFGRFLEPIFKCKGLRLATKRMVYRAVILPTLFYGAETWTVKASHLRRLNTFHRDCIRTILGVTRRQQWEDKLRTAELAKRFGMEEEMTDLLRVYRLSWFGHVARMDSGRDPKKVLFSELTATRPRHGQKRRWRDLALADLNSAGNPESEWYSMAQERGEWRQACRGKSVHPPPR